MLGEPDSRQSSLTKQLCVKKIGMDDFLLETRPIFQDGCYILCIILTLSCNDSGTKSLHPHIQYISRNHGILFYMVVSWTVYSK